MKKITMTIMTTLMLFTFLPTLKAGTGNIPALMDSTKTAESAMENVLISRLNEIHEMDKSNMKSQEKRRLRKEVRSIQSQLDHGGVYISAGAIIITLLLLIILL